MKSKKQYKDSQTSTIQKDLTKPIKTKKKYRWGLRLIVAVIILAILAGGAIAVISLTSLNKVLQKRTGIAAAGLKGDLELSKLKGEGEGRVNILLLGTGDAGHAGEGLTDTMIVASIDPKSKDVAMLGIPRDLYVKIPGFGWDKVNSAHALAEQENPGSGPELAKKTISEFIGQPIHYFVRLDFTGLKSAVDSLGGVDIYNSSYLSDTEYPCDTSESKSCGFKLNSGYYHMDGALALKYARCRKGTCGDDYGRARRQQSVVVGMRDQALRLGNILNPAKVADLIGIAGDHLKTDISIDELKRLADLASKVNSNKIANKVLDSENEGLVVNSSVGEASVVVPAAGIGKYGGIKAFVRSIFIDGYVKSELAKVEIRNSNAKPGAVYALSSILKSLGYNVINTSAVQDKGNGSGNTQILDYTNGSSPYTLKYLENRLKQPVSKAEKPAGSQADIVIILGAEYEPQGNI